jgi:hypothetical protein
MVPTPSLLAHETLIAQSGGPRWPVVSVPAAVRLDDLAVPRFPEQATAVFAALADMAPGCVLEPEALMEVAAEGTGLTDFGEASFREPLGVLCTALRTEAGLSPYGVVNAWSQIVRLLKNRLLVEDLLRRHPEIHQVPVDRPIVITGLPRSGTTHLHNLLSADPALRALPYWESVEPVLPDDERPSSGEPDPRLARIEQTLAFMNEALPYWRRMHEMTVDHSHEEIQLLAMNFSGTLFAAMGPIPSYWQWYHATDQTGSYRYMRTLLQVMTWLRGGERWVLKAPQHLEQFKPLMTAFPDATVVITHRDPVSIAASLTTMMAYVSRVYHDTVDLPATGRFWADRIIHQLNSSASDRDLLPPVQSIDVLFHDFMADPLGTVEKIYARAGQPFTERTRTALEMYQASHPRGRHGGMRYDLADFDLDPDHLRRATRGYVARFGVLDEWRAAPAHRQPAVAATGRLTLERKETQC